MIKSFKNLPGIIRDYRELSSQLKTTKEFTIKKFLLIGNEKTEGSATLCHFYFYQDLYIAQKIHQYNPEKHVDIGSRVDGFIAHIASFRHIEMFDIRPLSEKIQNVHFTQGDLLRLDAKYHAYTDSVSSLSVIEHFGLGRYGDTIDVDGHIRGIQAIHAMLKPGGMFYFSVPIGPQMIVFNAHRIFSMEYLIQLVEKMFTIEEFSYIDDTGNFFENIKLSPEGIASNFGCTFGNGIFVLKKK